MSRTVKFRHNVSIPLAGLIACLGAVPLAGYRWYLTPILLVPLAVVVWGIRAGTDAGPAGVTVRALLGRRRLPWSEIQGFAQTDRRVIAVMAGGRSANLPAVTPADLPRLVAASGTPLTGSDGDPADATGRADPADASLPADASPSQEDAGAAAR